MLFAFHARCLNLEHWDAVAVDVVVVVVAAVDWNEHHLPIEHVRSTWWLRNNLIHSEAISWSECSSDRNIRVLLYFGVGLFSRFRALQEHAYETCMLRYICTLDHIIRSGTSFCVGLSLSGSLSLPWLSLSLCHGSLCLLLYFTINFDIWKMQMAELTQIAYELGIKHQQSHELWANVQQIRWRIA